MGRRYRFFSSSYVAGRARPQPENKHFATRHEGLCRSLLRYIARLSERQHACVRGFFCVDK
jgi:hypothetical protein